jgi:Pyruvate flavodoxin/ferredoxin oxidoreductase, thiamine diP-bdg
MDARLDPLRLLGLGFEVLERSIVQQFRKKGEEVAKQGVSIARAGYEHAKANFVPFPVSLPHNGTPLDMWSGNEALAMGAAAGVKFYAAYPMSPSTGVLHWMAASARDLGIAVSQVEDEIAVANMVIGAAHAGCRAMCATSGGGFALMTEAIGSAGMMEITAVFIRRPACRPIDGGPDEDRPRGSVADTRRESGKLRAPHRGTEARAGRVQHHSDWKTACEKAMMWGETIYIGLFFETDARDRPVDLDPVLSEGGPLARRPLGLTKEQARWMLQRMS